MARRTPRFVISLQATKGTAPAMQFEVTGFKAEKILDIIDSDLTKYKRKKETVSATLMPFFTDYAT